MTSMRQPYIIVLFLFISFPFVLTAQEEDRIEVLAKYVNQKVSKINIQFMNKSSGMARPDQLVTTMKQLSLLDADCSTLLVELKNSRANDTSHEAPSRVRGRGEGGRLTRPVSNSSGSSSVDLAIEHLETLQSGIDQGLNDRFSPFLKEMNEFSSYATAQRIDAMKYADKMKSYLQAMESFSTFCGSPVEMESSLKKARELYDSMRSAVEENVAEYRTGPFHTREGSGIYIVQEDGVTPETLTENKLTDKIILDGKRPVHVFVLTDYPIELYSSSGMGAYVQFALVNQGDGQFEDDYIGDASRALPVTRTGQAYQKLTLVPSENWADLEAQYEVSAFYNCLLQMNLANSLIPGEEKSFTIYSANGQLQKDITIVATQDGIDFLKAMKVRMKEFEIDHARMEEPAVSDHTMENEISNQFKALNPNVTLVKTILTSKPWYLVRNHLGEIIYMDFYAQVAFKDSSGTYFTQKLYLRSNLEGSTYGPMIMSVRTDPREIRAENIK